MKKIRKSNVVLSVEEKELDTYLAQGYIEIEPKKFVEKPKKDEKKKDLEPKQTQPKKDEKK